MGLPDARRATGRPSGSYEGSTDHGSVIRIRSQGGETLNYGVSVPNFHEYSDPLVLTGLARDAEGAGWDGFFIWDHVLFVNDRRPVVDPWVALTAVARATERVRIGPMVTALARRRPWKLARETVSLDRLSDGRLTLGVGLGEPADVEFGLFDEEVDPKARAKKLDEGLDILVGLWSGQPFSYDGEYYKVEETVFLPPPVQSPRIPIWVAAGWPSKRPVRRAARWDGVFPLSRAGGVDRDLNLDELEELLAYLRAHRTGVGPFDVVVSGQSPAEKSVGAELVSPYAEAGATWWIEGIDSSPGSLGEARARIRLGPPKT